MAIEVVGPEGRSFAADDTVVVTIAGIRGALQYFQFDSPGSHDLPVAVSRTGGGTTQVEHGRATIRVDPLAPDARVELPILRLARMPAREYLLGLSVGPDSPFRDGLVAGPVASPPILLRPPEDGKPRIEVRTQLAGSGPRESLRPAIGVARTDIAAAVSRTARRRDTAASHVPARRAPTRAPTYRWDFGDGTSQDTSDPHVIHDYEHALAPDREHNSFHVRLRIDEPGREPVDVARTISVFSAYAICKRFGTLAPKVANTAFATRTPTGYEGTLTVHNIEPFALELTSRVVHPVLVDPHHIAAFGPEEVLTRPILVPANGTATFPVTVSTEQVAMDASGFATCYCGATADGKAIRVTGHFDIAPRDRISHGVKLAGIAVTHLDSFWRDVDGMALSPVASSGSSGVAPHIGGLGSERTANSARLAATRPSVGGAARVMPGIAGLPRDALARLPAIHLHSETSELPPAEGEQCDPDNVSDAASADGWACQATEERQVFATPGRFLNARKGDVVLSPGGPGVIGSLLRQVSPPQRYSHCGIMTRNYDQVTHSTTSEDRMLDYPVGGLVGSSKPAPSNGYRPDIVKYGWPGVVTQSVEQSVHGEAMLDPETATLPIDQQKWHTVSGFGRSAIGMDIGGHWEIVPPLVVRPDPLQEARHPEVRSALHRVADEALALTGKSHYRFYCYTEPSLGLTTVAPAEARWAAGTLPTVCSSLIWIACRKQGVRMEGPRDPVGIDDLEFADRMAGAQVDASTSDGLYLYNTAERLAAAEYLFGALHAKVSAKLDAEAGDLAGVFEAFSDMADDVANQVVNTFAFDWSDEDAKDSERWREVSSANAVSPDNIMLWDGPDRGGIYGAVEPLHYREPRLDTVTVHRWKHVLVRGAVSGTVRYEGAPAAGATVQFSDGLTTFSDELGHYELRDVPLGSYVVKAAKDQVGVMLLAEVPFTVAAAESALDIELHPPSEWFRVLRVSGKMHIVDSEFWESDEVADRSFSAELFVGPYGTHAETTFVERMGGEIRVEARVVADWHVDRSISIVFEQRFYEGSSEESDDLDGFNTFAFTLQADWWQDAFSTVSSSDAGSDRIDLTFSNDVNPS